MGILPKVTFFFDGENDNETFLLDRHRNDDE